MWTLLALLRLASGVKKVGAGWPALVCWEEVGVVWTSPSRLELLVLLGCRWKWGTCYLAQCYTNCCDEASFQSSELAPSLCHLTPLLWWQRLGSQTADWSFGQQRWPGASLRGCYGGSWCLCESLKQWFYLRRQASECCKPAEGRSQTFSDWGENIQTGPTDDRVILTLSVQHFQTGCFRKTTSEPELKDLWANWLLYLPGDFASVSPAAPSALESKNNNKNSKHALNVKLNAMRLCFWKTWGQRRHHLTVSSRREDIQTVPSDSVELLNS